MPKNKDEWTKFIKRLLARHRSNRPYLLPRDYIEAVAESIHSTSPTLGIITNTLADFYSTAFRRGYERKESDIKFFKEKQEKAITADWNKIKDAIDYEINTK